MITWDDEFCEQLAEHGFHVIRFDNRDIGLSTKMEQAGMPDVMAAFAGDAQPAYTLDDMADDAVGLFDTLGIGAVHVVGKASVLQP
jgi:pimeloyl-ACP methyl ester carboxylesterase